MHTHVERPEVHGGIGVILVGYVEHLPVFEVVDPLVAILLHGNRNVIRDALEIAYSALEIDAAHSLDEDVELSPFPTRLNDKLLLSVATVEGADVLAVNENLSIIVRLVYREQRRSGESRQRSAVED